MDKNWSIDHIGHAVHDLEKAVSFYAEILGFSEECREYVESQEVDVVFMVRGDSCIELLAARREESLLGRFLRSRGEGIHHICYRVASVVDELERLANAGVKLIDTVPRPGARNTEIAFLHPKSTLGVLIELCAYR